MGKVEFSRKVNDMMLRKAKALKYGMINNFFEEDEYFELVLCLAYMSLSKEMIILKDKKNRNRLDRITNLVDKSEIDRLFQPEFNSELPVIMESCESDSVWILDAIRDSIMHGKFDVDEERQCFIIDNDQVDRILKAEIPFSWFIAYAKNEILKMKQYDKCTVRGFYYNKEKAKRYGFNLPTELTETILYEVRVTGHKINLHELERKVEEVFARCSREVLSNKEREQYSQELTKIPYSFDISYLISFERAKHILIEELKKTYPDADIKIFINNQKNRISNKLLKRLPQRYKNYDVLFNNMQSIFRKKSTNLLNFIITIIENVGNKDSIDFKEVKSEKISKMLYRIFEQEDQENVSVQERYEAFKKNLKSLEEIFIHIYGLSTLVINHETLYNDSLKKEEPTDYGLIAHSKQKHINYSATSKAIIKRQLDLAIKKREKINQLAACPTEDGKARINAAIQKINMEFSTLEERLNNMKVKGYKKESDIPSDNESEEDKIFITYLKTFMFIEDLDEILIKLITYFMASKELDEMIMLKEMISRLLDIKDRREEKYMYACCNMEETLTIIRNSLSHIGRVSIVPGKNNEEVVILNDYDEHGEKSGEVIGSFDSIISLLSQPFEKAKEYTKKEES